MAQYEISVYLYAHNEYQDGIAIVAYRTPAATGHLELEAVHEFSAASTVLYNHHSEHVFTMRASVGEASRGAFAATIVDKFARALNSIVKSITYERAEYVTATLCDNKTVHIPEARKPNEPTKRGDDPRGSFIASPAIFFGSGRVCDKRNKWWRAVTLWRKEYELRCGLRGLLKLHGEVRFRTTNGDVIGVQDDCYQSAKKARVD